MRRVYIKPQDLQAGEVVLASDETRYLRNVLRVQVGEQVELFDGQGQRAEARLVELRKQGARCQVSRIEADDAAAKITVCSALPLLKGERLDLAVRMLTELGVSRIQLLICERAVVQTGRAEARMQRLQRIAVAAARQSGRARVPEICAPLSLADWTAQAAGLKLFGDLESSGLSAHAALSPDSAGQVALCTGPEGGWTALERQALLDGGFVAVSLGPSVLRAETAALALLAGWWQMRQRGKISS